jgi:hypothetical protein
MNRDGCALDSPENRRATNFEAFAMTIKTLSKDIALLLHTVAGVLTISGS